MWCFHRSNRKQLIYGLYVLLSGKALWELPTLPSDQDVLLCMPQVRPVCYGYLCPPAVEWPAGTLATSLFLHPLP